MDLDRLLKFMTDKGASDLHLKPTRPPLLRINGRLLPIEAPPLKPDELLACVRSAIGEMPLVAIGGIQRENITGVLAAGADSAAMIGDIVSGPDEIEQRLRDLAATIA